MRRGDQRLIEVDGQKMLAEFLGKGHYCQAYRVNDTVYCFVVEDEYMKDCLVECCPAALHIPAITRHDETRKGPDRKVYSMPYYANITKDDKEAWAILKTLKTTSDRILTEKYMSHKGRDLPRYGNQYGQDIIEATQGKIPESVTDALQNLIDAAANYGAGVTFEFGKRNIGVDQEGNIVFRDILFDAEKINREWEQKRVFSIRRY